MNFFHFTYIQTTPKPHQKIKTQTKILLFGQLGYLTLNFILCSDLEPINPPFYPNLPKKAKPKRLSFNYLTKILLFGQYYISTLS